MRRSKLELYEEMLRALVSKSLSVDNIAYKCKMDCIALRQRLSFLIKNGLIKEENCKKKTVCTLTKRGLAISNTFIITRRLEKLQTPNRMIDDALQVTPNLAEHRKETPKRTRRNENY
jgi:predicted transcriptional regulator